MSSTQPEAVTKNGEEAISSDLNSLSLEQTESSARVDYLEWNEYFMAVSFLSALRSKDPSTQVGLLFKCNANRKPTSAHIINRNVVASLISLVP